GAHEALAHQRRAGALGGEAANVVGGTDAALGHEDTARAAERGGEALEARVLDLQGLEIAGVHPDQRGAERVRGRELERLDHLEQHVETQPARGGPQLGQAGRLERPGDEQHRVRSGVDGLGEHVGLDDEVLPEERDVHRGPNRAQVLQPSPEASLLGEDADAAGAAVDVGPGLRRGVDGPDGARGRGRALHLADQRKAAPGPEGTLEPRGAPRPAGDLGQERRPLAPSTRTVLDGAGDQLGERAAGWPPGAPVRAPGTHAATPARVRATRRSSRVRAAPESMLSAARRTPSASVSTASATHSAAPAFRSTASRTGPSRPSSRVARSRAFSSGVPPWSAPAGTGFSPPSSGWRTTSRTWPASTQAARVGPLGEISSSPSRPCTTSARSVPRRASVSATTGTSAEA